MIIIQTNPLSLHLKSAFFGFNKEEYRTSLVSKSLPIKKPIFATHSIWAIKTMHNVLPRGRSNEPWNRIVCLYLWVFCYNFRVHRDTTHQRQVSVGFGTAFLSRRITLWMYFATLCPNLLFAMCLFYDCSDKGLCSCIIQDIYCIESAG